MKKIYIVLLISVLFNFNNIYSQGNTCAQATPFCTSVGTPFTYPNIHNGSLAPSSNSYGCLCDYDAYNPSWFYLQTTGAGTMNFTINQLTGGGSGIDVDFVAWGPFNTVSSMCGSLTGNCSINCTSNSNVTCSGNIEDCGSSSSATETMSLVSTAPGQYFLIMITNFDNVAGNITLTQTSGPGTNCDITCPSILSGPGIVNQQGDSGGGTPAVNLPATVSCTTSPFSMYPTNNTPFGHPLQPAVMIGTYANAQNGNTIRWYENGGLVLTSSQITPNTSYQNLFIGVSPSATTSFSFCETVNSTDMGSQILDAATGNLIANYTWVSDGVCSGYTLPPGSVKGISTWSSTCGACVTGVEDWGYAVFNPAAASIGTHTITYSFDPQKPGCPTFTTSVTITVTNPFNATFTPPGPLCVNAACSVLTPANTYTVGSSGWSGTGVSSNSFCPSSSGAGTFPVTYSVGTSATCRASSSANVVVNSLPTVTAAAANSGTLCSGSSINLTSGGANTYTWNPGNINGSAITVTPSASPTTYTVQGTNTTTGCRNQATVTVTISPTPTVSVTNPASTNTSTLCSGNSTTLTASSSAGTTFNWSPAAGLSSTTGSTVIASPTVTTVYSVTGTSTSGCNTTASSQGSFTVYVNTTPTIGITAANSGTVCSGSTIGLTGTGAGAGTYSWVAPAGGGLSSTTGANVNITPSSSPMTYTVIGTAPGGCTNTAQTTVTVLTTPTISVTNSLSTNSSTICSGNSVTLSAAGASSYNWSPASGLSSTNSATVIASPTATTIYTVTGTSTGGCNTTASSQGTFTVNVNTTPTIGITASNSGTVCSGSSISLTGTGAGAGTYSWSAPAGGGLSGTTGTTVNITPTSSPITYTVIGTAPGGCTNTAQRTVTVITTPTISVTNSLSTNTSTICSGNSVQLSASGASSYNWTPASGLSSTTSGTVIASPTVTTVYTVTGTSAGGCNTTSSSQGTFTVNVNITPTIGLTASNSGTLCSGTSITLTGTGVGSGTYSWTSSAGGGLGSTTGSTVGITPTATLVTYTVTGQTTAGCSNTAQTTVTVSPTPTISVTNSLSANSSTICSGNSVVLSATGASSYTWTPGAGLSSTSGSTVLATPTNTSSATIYTVTGSSASGCVNPASSQGTFTIVVNPTPTVTSVSGTNSTSVCAGTPISGITFSINPAGSINWTNSNTAIGLASSGSGSVIPTFTAANVSNPTTGVLTVTATATSGGCSTTAASQLTYSITVNPLPVMSFAANSVTTTCTSPTSVLNAIATPSAGVTYSWTAPASGSLNSYTISNPTASGNGVFTVTATGPAGGCSSAASQATIEVISDAATPTVSLSANSLSITCTNTTVTTAITSTNSITSYNWNPNPVSGGANPVFNSPGTYNATLTASNGCLVNVSVNVVNDNAAPVVTLSTAVNSETITCNNPSVTITPTITPGSNLSYTWTSGTSQGISTPVNQSTATFTAAGVYTLAVTNTLTGCVTSSTNTANTFTVVANNSVPTLSLLTTGQVMTTCASPNATLTASSNAGSNAVYTWTTPTSSTLTGSSIISSATGVYSVSITNTLTGCTSTVALSQSTVEVVADAGTPSVTLTANTLSITCSNPTPSLSVTTNTTVTYNWTPTSGIVAGTETTASPTFSAPGTYSLVVTNNSNGCSSSISNNVIDVVNDNTNPVVNLSLSSNTGTINCSNLAVNVTPTITPNSNLTYTWTSTSGTGISTPVNQANATFTAAGIYTLAVTNTVNGCVSTSTNTANTFTVYQDYTTPTATINVSSTNTIIGCGAGNSTVTLSSAITSTNATTVNWLPGNVTNTTLDVVSSGTYTLIVTDAVSGCTVETQYTVNGNTSPPQNVDAGTNVMMACSATTVQLSGNTTSNNVSYLWTGPSATSIISGSNTAISEVGETGTYTLTVTDNLTGCFSTATVNVLQANVTASFTANPTTGASPLTVTFTDASIGATTWNWSFGDANISNSQNPSNVYTTGTYTVMLTASSGSCTSTASVVIVVEDGFSLEIPNVFTPNADGANDLFKVKSTGVKEISLQIFNRWGEKLYEFTGPKASWDGLSPNGMQVPEGTYFFFIKAIGFDSTEVEKQGTINLFR